MFYKNEMDISLHGGIPNEFYNIKQKNFAYWEIPPWELKIFSSKKLGEGDTSNVYLAIWKETYVAAKIIKNIDKNEYINNFESIARMHHPNIVQLLGYVEDPFIIVTEYFKNKSLDNNLLINNKKEITLDILKGLNYIHTNKNIFFHYDIKLSNILISNSKIAKIGNIGYIYLKNKNLKKNITPEIKIGFEYTSKGDIYLCGILIYELFERKEFKEFICSTFNSTPKYMKTLIYSMTNENDEKRPSAQDSIRFLNF